MALNCLDTLTRDTIAKANKAIRYTQLQALMKNLASDLDL